MKYRKMGSLEWEVSALGFGAMRLPTNQQMRVDEEEAIKMIRYAIDNGVNYVDTAYPYHNGESEVVVGKALKDGYREKVHLTTKSPLWMIKKAEDFDTYLNEQIKRLQTKPDIYLFHGLNRDRLEKIKNLNLIEKIEEAKRNGLIKHIGFSFHDNFEVFKEIIDYYKWDCCQIQYNYLDIEYQAGTKGVQYANSKGVALIVMEPIRGGKLAIPDRVLSRKPEIKEVLDKSQIKRSMPDWALQFVWNHPEVSVVLSGMSTMPQVVENVESANNSGINSLTKEELQTISELREAFSKYIIVPCTSCGYCLPCPNGVSIPGVLRLVNDLYYWGDRGKPRLAFFYNRMAKTEKDLEKRKAEGDEAEGAATLCKQCGECLEKCPQQIDIPSCMENANALFEEGKSISEVFE
ncbi:MAG: aldo/keto reductase [Candidatus Heimdallarchaeota archaeon]|nr:MAG: aldo/keto reductase [Candidatus Heimdallarchaeota archaeon]